jgi:TetR/AcrR family transcriptional repressor of nem operon
MVTAFTTRDKIIELGRNFVQRLGYHAFKYQLIAKELNIKNAAIHHYFPAKEDLGTAIIEKDLGDFQTMTRTSGSTAFEKAISIIYVYQTYYNEGKNLCIIGACISAYSELPEKMATAAKKYQDTIYNWLVNTFKEGLANGEFHFTDTPENLAALWLATLPGAIQAAQTRGKGYFDQVLDQLIGTLLHY